MEQRIDDIIEQNMGLVYSQLQRFGLLDDPDALSISMEALYNAICDYNPERGTQLSTVAVVYIYNALNGHLRKLNAKRQIKPASYNCKVGDENEAELIDLVSSDYDLEYEVLEKELYKVTMQAFHAQYATLNSPERRAIIDVWYKSDFAATTIYIASVVNKSQSYVSQTIGNFKAALRKRLKEYYYD